MSFNHLYSLVFSCILLYTLVFPVTDLIQCLIVLYVYAAPPFLTAITSNSSALLTWDDDPEPFFFYEIFLTGVSTPNPVTAAFFQTQRFPVGQATSIQVNQLLAGSTYNFSVRAIGNAGPSPFVSVVNTTLDGCELPLDSVLIYAST